MVGAILARVLSRAKMNSVTGFSDTLNEKHDYSSILHNKSQSQSPSTTSSPSDNSTMNEHKRVISFQQNVKHRSTEIGAIQPSLRKHSYASVKEDSDVPQSFQTRHLRHEEDGSADTAQSYDQCSLDKAEKLLSNSGPAGETSVGDVEDDSAILADDEEDVSEACRTVVPPPGLETVPDEILDLIFSLTTLSADKDRWQDPRVDLFNLLFVSKAVHAAALRVLYRHVKIPQSKAFFKFSSSLAQEQQLGELVQCLDFSHYSSIGFGRAKSVNNMTPYLTPTTLKSCLDQTTNLKAFLVHEHIDDEIDAAVLSKLFSMPSLRALDFCSCSSTSFQQAFKNFCTSLSFGAANANTFLSIERLSLHECTTLRPEVFETLMPRLNKLTHLDVAHTLINDKALMSIPHTARITHLNLERCTRISGEAIVEFLTTHPAVTDSLVYLNLQADASRYRLLSEDDLETLLPLLPTTLCSLNIGGARINKSHIPCLRKLSTHLEELGLKGADLGLGAEIRQILSLDSTNETKVPHSLRYIDLTDVTSVTQMSLTYSPATIIGKDTMPLEVIELSESVRKDIEKRNKHIKKPDWVVRELGRRGWFVRQLDPSTSSTCNYDDGYRKWKMGARWWGMRKIPMFEQDTGGMYGYFMFKKA